MGLLCPASLKINAMYALLKLTIKKLLSVQLLINIIVWALLPVAGNTQINKAVEKNKPTLTGKVTDLVTGQPLGVVSVLLHVHPSQGIKQYQCITHTNGTFALPYPLDGAYDTRHLNDTLFIQASGYYTDTTVIVPSELSPELSIRLIPKDNHLSTVLVTASRFKQYRTDIPAGVGVVDSQQIQNTKATSIDQLVNQVPGVYMTDLGNEQHEMSIRQPITTKSLFLYPEDGLPIRTSGLYNHNSLLEMNLAATSRIEILKGPASAQYGPEAIGGAVNLITANPPDRLSGKLSIQADNNGYKKTTFQAGDKTGKWGWIVSGYYANRHNGPIDYSDFHKSAITFNSIYTLNSTLSWHNKATYVDYYADMSGSLDSAAFAHKDFNSHYLFTYRKVKAFRATSVLNKQWQTGNTKLSFMYRNNQTGQNPAYRIKDDGNNALKASGQINLNAFHSYVGLLQHYQHFNWKNSSLIVGINADISPSHYKANYIDIRKNSKGDYVNFQDPDSLLTKYQTNINNYAVFMQWQMMLLPGLKLTLAGRYDRFEYNFKNNLNSNAVSGAPSSRVHFDHWTPKVGFNYNLKNAGFYASYSEGYVPPQVTELFNNVKVPFLKPQEFLNYELGGWLKTPDNRLQIDWSLYQMEGKGEIISVRNSDGSSENKNAGKTNHRGLELGLHYKPDQQWDFHLGGSLASHTFKNEVQNGHILDGHKMQVAPDWTSNNSVYYHPGFLKGLRFGLEYQYVGSYYMDDANTTRYKGFGVVNVRSGFQWHQFEVWANALNILDLYYADLATKSAYGYSYNLGTPFTISAGFAYHF